MELRPELCPPVVPPQRITELCASIESITELLERGQSADAAIAAFNAETGHGYIAEDFLTYWGSRDLEDFALEAAGPVWPKVPDVTRDELIEIVRRILEADDDMDYYVLVLKSNVVHPEVDGLIFWPPRDLVDASPEDLPDAALSYRPIAL